VLLPPNGYQFSLARSRFPNEKLTLGSAGVADEKREVTDNRENRLCNLL
jgi:hypothetical protein